jgi:hypothetical protein
MATPTGGYRRSFIDSTIDIANNATSAVYTCPANTNAEFILLSGIQTSGTSDLGGRTVNTFLRQVDPVGNTIQSNQIDQSGVTTSTATVFNPNRIKNNGGSSEAFRYFLKPGDTLMVQNATPGSKPATGPIRVKYLVIEEINSDI